MMYAYECIRLLRKWSTLVTIICKTNLDRHRRRRRRRAQ